MRHAALLANQAVPIYPTYAYNFNNSVVTYTSILSGDKHLHQLCFHYRYLRKIWLEVLMGNTGK